MVKLTLRGKPINATLAQYVNSNTLIFLMGVEYKRQVRAYYRVHVHCNLFRLYGASVDENIFPQHWDPYLPCYVILLSL